MDYIKYLLECAMSYLAHEKEFYTAILQQSPEGGLIHERTGDRERFLHCIPTGENAGGRRRYQRKTIRPAQTQLLNALADKEYARSALRIAEANLAVVRSAMRMLQTFTHESVREGMRRSYQKLPREHFRMLRAEDDQALEQKKWAEAPYRQSAYRAEEKIHITSRGLAMRSRAEVMIAELLYKYEIPFRYEQILWVGDREMAPDFTFPGGDGRPFYWEYCGMMDDPDYVRKQLRRRSFYEEAGVTEWDNMIYTYHTKGGVDMREIEAIIQTKVLPRLQGGPAGTQVRAA